MFHYGTRLFDGNSHKFPHLFYSAISVVITKLSEWEHSWNCMGYTRYVILCKHVSHHCNKIGEKKSQVEKVSCDWIPFSWFVELDWVYEYSMNGCSQLMPGNFRQGLIEKIVSFPSDLLFSPRFSVQCYEGKKQYDSLWIFMKLADLMIGSLNLLY